MCEGKFEITGVLSTYFENSDLYEELSKNTPHVTVHECPVCIGRGTVPAGFYESSGPTFTSAGMATVPCRGCGGNGVVVV